MDFMEKVTEISKKVGGAAEKTYMAAKDKSGKLIEETKIKLRINESEKEISEAFEEIGIAVYDSYTKGEDKGKGFTKECKRIEKIKKEILEMENSILYLKNLRKCEDCTEIISMDDKFCTICGAPQKAVKIKKIIKKETEVEEKPTSKACKSCGQLAELDIKFCSKCGYEF